MGGLSIAGTGCRENKANAEVAVFPAAATSPQPASVWTPAAPASAAVPAMPPASANPVVAANPVPPPPPAPIIITNPAPATPASDAPTAPASAAPAVQVVQEPIIPEEAAVSPSLADLVKMIHSGVSEDVLVSYVTNSSDAFYVGADQVVYLKDIGASPALITTLLLHEGQPQIVARRQAVAAVKPLPEGVAVNTPVAKIYPGQTRQTQSSEPTPVSNSFEASAAPPPPSGTEPVAVGAEQPAVEVSSFYSSMAPYGAWVDIPDYGYCWRPTVAIHNTDWAPYRDSGRWLWSDSGWYWYSDYSWGWAPFHYGRWATYPGYGWVWSPGTVWGPAWVTWRYDNSYCGWAPLPPACGYSMGVGLTWGGGAAGFGFGFGLSSSYYTFLGWNNFGSRYPYRYYARPAVVRNIFNNTVVVNNYYAANNRTVINRGVGTERIAGPVPRATIREASLSGGKMPGGASRREMLHKDGTLSVYRPENLGANGAVATRRVTAAPGTSSGRPSLTPTSRPAGMERTVATTRSGAVSTGVPAASAAPGSSSSRPAAAMPASRFQQTPRATAPGTTPSAPATRTSPTVYPGARSSTPSVTRPPSSGGTVRSAAPTPTAPRSVTTPSAPSSRAPSPSSRPAPSYRAPSAPSYTPRSSAPSTRSYSAPAVRSTPSYSAPAVRSAPSYSAPAVRSAPSHSAPATRSTPSGGRSGRD